MSEQETPYSNMEWKELCFNYRHALDMIQEANEHKTTIESIMLERFRSENPNHDMMTGSGKLEGVKFTFSTRKVWDQEKLAELKRDDKPWPFKTEYKSAADRIKWMHQNYPDYMKQLEFEALTTIQNKPRISLLEDGK